MRFRRVDPVTAWGTNGAAHGPHHERLLDASDIVELVERRRQGWTVVALANAYGLSTRTVIRWGRATVHIVHCGGWRAIFATGTEDRPWPLQLTRWQRVDDDADPRGTVNGGGVA